MYGCTHPAATNLDTVANIDDDSCRFEIYGCTDPRAVNFFILADIDDGSCLYLGCTDSAAPNFDPAAMLDDGSCAPVVPGCLDTLAVNFASSANTHEATQCIYGGCTNTSAKNYNPSATVDDGTCEHYMLGCLDSRAANFHPEAEREGGSCLYLGCVHSMARNYDATASLDDGTCRFTSAHGTIAAFGYLQGCRAFVDGFGAGFSGASAPGTEDPIGASSSLGRYEVHYLQRGLVGIDAASVSSGYPCTDSVTGAPLEVPLRTALNASIASPLTSVAIGQTIIRRYEQCGGWASATAAIASSGGGAQQAAACLAADAEALEDADRLRNASEIVCRNLVPAIPCSISLQPCDTQAGRADVCSMGGERLR